MTAAEFAYNNALQASTKNTPFMLNYGHHPSASIMIKPEDVTVPAAEEFALTMANLIKVTLDNLEHAQSSQAEYANKSHQEIHFEVRQMVLVNANLFTSI